MFADGSKVHQLSMVEISNPDDVSKKCPMLVKDAVLTLRNRLPSGEVLSLRINLDEMPLFEQFTCNLKWKQIQALWLIAEGDVLPQMGGRGQAG